MKNQPADAQVLNGNAAARDDAQSDDIAPVLSQPRSFNAPAEAEWHRMIAEAAYYLAAKRNFVAGNELEDWLAAEAAAQDFLSPH